MAHMRWAMKPGESLISVTLAPVRASDGGRGVAHQVDRRWARS